MSFLPGSRGNALADGDEIVLVIPPIRSKGDAQVWAVRQHVQGHDEQGWGLFYTNPIRALMDETEGVDWQQCKMVLSSKQIAALYRAVQAASAALEQEYGGSWGVDLPLPNLDPTKEENDG